MTAEREKLADRWRCPQCNYSVPPKSIRTERKHFTAHSLQCERCKYQTETKPSWDEAIASYRTPREITPSFNDAIEAAAKALDGLKMNSFDDWGGGWNQALEVGARDIRARALSIPAPGGVK